MPQGQISITERDVVDMTATMRGVGYDEALSIARKRNWIGEAGDVTAEGAEMVAALGEQSHTRTVFR